MGTRLAPVLVLLLAACTATGGTGGTAKTGGPPQPGAVIGVPPPPVPAGQAESTGSASSTAAAGANTNVGNTDTRSSEIAGAPAKPGTNKAVAAGTGASGGAAPGGSGDTGRKAGGGADSAVPPEPAERNGGQASGQEQQVAAMDPTMDPKNEFMGLEAESLFGGDLAHYCEAMWRLGEYIASSRRNGDPRKLAIKRAVARIAVEMKLPLDNRLTFSGQVYGRMVYRLEDSHAARTFGAYAQFACLTVRGDKKIVPGDPRSARLLNDGLRRCESRAFTQEDLKACVYRELTPIVDRYNS